MSKTCDTYIPLIQSQDECHGDRTNAKCVIDSNMYIELGLEENSSQEQINQALYTALLAQNEIIEDLQNQIENLPNYGVQ